MQSNTNPAARRRRTAKGRRPFFFEDPNTDKLLSIVAALAGEVCVLRQRLDTHERIAEMRRLFTIEDIEAFAPDEPTSDARALWREEFLQRVFRILELQYTQPELQREESAYSEMIQTFARPAEAGDDQD
jgi:hypothetical protein